MVVEAVSFAVAPGQAAALIGRSGAGKSSLLAAAAAAIPLHGGEILVAGRSVRREAAGVRRSVGYVPSRLPSWPGLRADEFLRLFAAGAGLSRTHAADAVLRALAMAGLERHGDALLDTLPAGQGKRLLVARALLHDPDVLLFDDPFAGLDPVERRDLERLIGDAHLMGRTVLAAVDDAGVPSCFTHLLVLAEGRLVVSGPHEPAAFGASRGWRCTVVCHGAADAAVRVVGTLVEEARAIDGDTVAIVLDPARGDLADVVAAVVRAGLRVAAAGFDPPWPAQLV